MPEGEGPEAEKGEGRGLKAVHMILRARRAKRSIYEVLLCPVISAEAVEDGKGCRRFGHQCGV